MGFLDGLFGGDKPTPKNIEKLVVKVKERYAQPEYRREAMEKLISFGTPEALTGAIQRFTVVAQSPHWDEEEKRWLVDELAQLGEPAKVALRAFLKSADHIAFAATALGRMTQKDELVTDLIASLQARPPEDHRTTQGKTELVAVLADTGHAGVLGALVPYLDDHADDVQCATVDALERLWANTSEKDPAKARLQAIITDDARSARVLRHTASAMHRLALDIDATKALAPAVAEDFIVKDGRLARPG